MIYLVSDPLINGDYAHLMLKKEFPSHQSLFKGTPDENLGTVAPYIFAVNKNPVKALEAYPGASLKAHIIIECDLSLDEAQIFFRNRIYISKEGKKIYFRCWDGRVLNNILPAYNQQQLRDFFGPVKTFASESDDSDYVMQFALKDGQLFSDKVAKHDFAANLDRDYAGLEPR